MLKNPLKYDNNSFRSVKTVSKGQDNSCALIDWLRYALEYESWRISNAD